MSKLAYAYLGALSLASLVGVIYHVSDGNWALALAVLVIFACRTWMVETDWVSMVFSEVQLGAAYSGVYLLTGSWFWALTLTNGFVVFAFALVTAEQKTEKVRTQALQAIYDYQMKDNGWTT